MFSRAFSLAVAFSLVHSINCYAITGSGKVAKEERKLPTFHAVVISVPAELDLKQGTASLVVVEADDNIVPVLKTEVKDGVLYIDTRENNIQSRSKISFKISSAKLDSFKSKGTCSAKISDLKCADFKVETNGTANVNLSGETNTFTSQIDGTGSLDSTKLNAKKVVLNIEGTGSAKVAASETLDASIKGTGTIKYSGNPKVNKKVFGLGTVTKI